MTKDAIEVPQEDINKVIGALENSAYRWRTVAGAAKEAKVTVDVVKDVINLNPHLIVKSSILSNTGEELYTTRKHYQKKADALTRFASALMDKVY